MNETLIGHFDFGGKRYDFVSSSPLKFKEYMGHWQTRFAIQTGSNEVRDVLNDIFTHSLKIKIKFDFPKRKAKFAVIHDCQIYEFASYDFGAQALIEGYLESLGVPREVVQFT